MTADDKHDLYRVYESIWRNMDREHQLINHRISWAIFFSAGVISISLILSNVALKLSDNAANHGYLVGVLVVLGTLSAAGCVFSNRVKHGVLAAHYQDDELRRAYSRLEDSFAELKLPRPFGEHSGGDRGWGASEIFPDALIIIWGIIAAAELIAALYLWLHG